MMGARDDGGPAVGVLHYEIYGQDGRLIPMTCADTPDMRRFVKWVELHDRYTEVSEVASVARTLGIKAERRTARQKDSP